MSNSIPRTRKPHEKARSATQHCEISPSPQISTRNLQRYAGAQQGQITTTDNIYATPTHPLFSSITRPRDRSERERMQVAQPIQLATFSSQPTPSSSSLARIDRSPKLNSSSSTPRHPPPSSPRRHASPQVVVSRPTMDADPEDFSRRLKISSSPSPRPSQTTQKQGASSKLFNPDTDPIPMRRTAEPESMSDATGSSYVQVPRGGPSSSSMPHREGSSAARQLFDHRKDDPVRFAVLARPQLSSHNGRPTPTPKMSADHVSASSASSYAPSIASSSFTLSSTTDGSSASSALFEGGRPNQGTEDSGNNVFSIQLKKLYRAITNLETKIKQEDSDESDDGMNSRVVLKGKEVENDELEKEMWRKQIHDHKEYVPLRIILSLTLYSFGGCLGLLKSSTTSSKSHWRPLSPPLSATSPPNTISSSAYGHTPSTSS